MAKRKNPLKDLDAFLKQEAKSIVEPDKVAESPTIQQGNSGETKPAELTETDIINFLANKVDSKDAFINIIQKAIEKSHANSSEHKMLLNTLLYIKDKDNWRESVTKYWS